MRHRRFAFSALLVPLLLFPVAAWPAPSVPSKPTLTSTTTTITVSWSAVASAAGYYLYWGETQEAVTTKTNPLKRSNTELGFSTTPAEGTDMTFTLGSSSGVTLKPATTYYVGLSSYDGTGEGGSKSTLSPIASIATKAAAQAPETPQNLALVARTDSAITLTWATGSGSAVTSYTVSVEKRSGETFAALSITPDAPINMEAPSATFSSLEADTRYRFAVKATNAEGSSDASASLVVDTFAAGETRDTLAPDVPTLSQSALPPELSENQTVRLRFAGNNDGMADLAGYRVYYGTSDTLDQAQDFAPTEAVVLAGLLLNTTYTFRVAAFDSSGNESAQSAESVSILVESLTGLLGDESEFQGGCFVTTPAKGPLGPLAVLPLLLVLAIPARTRKRRLTAAVVGLLLLLAPATGFSSEANTVGIKAGLSLPSDDRFTDVYDRNEASFSLFYQRQAVGNLFASVEAGYGERRGKKRTASGAQSDADTTLTLAPLSASLTWEVTLAPDITLFAGGGLDYWYYRETNETGTVDAKKDGEYGVGGYHGRAGLKLLSGDPLFDHRAGVILETVYSVIDRVGENSLDLGGWAFNAGIFFIY